MNKAIDWDKETSPNYLVINNDVGFRPSMLKEGQEAISTIENYLVENSSSALSDQLNQLKNLDLSINSDDFYEIYLSLYSMSRFCFNILSEEHSSEEKHKNAVKEIEKSLYGISRVSFQSDTNLKYLQSYYFTYVETIYLSIKYLEEEGYSLSFFMPSVEKSLWRKMKRDEITSSVVFDRMVDLAKHLPVIRDLQSKVD
jgi:hypothetical protein